MARKTRHRISYVLPLASASAGHRLGINSLATDENQHVLYSAGRDGAIYAWDVASDSSVIEAQSNGAITPSARHTPRSTYRQHVQAHSNWINDISLVDNSSALVSASSDASVKIWRPKSQSGPATETIGLHTDYIKCVASPGPQSPWVAAGGLDRKIGLWDLHGSGQIHCIDVADEERPIKGSVYALAANTGLIASGGPESIVKLWDSRTGKMISKFVGHTDNIRSILISRDNDMVISASSDQTIKVWSVTAGRCMYNLGMHKDSVWSLASSAPDLSILYSGDRSGVVAKTDTRGASDIDQGLSVALCQENEGINSIQASENSLWTATASSSINRWRDVDTSAGVHIPDSLRNYRTSNAAQRQHSVSSQSTSQGTKDLERKQIPLHSVMRLSSTSLLPSQLPYQDRRRPSVAQHGMSRKASTSVVELDAGNPVPIRSVPVETIEGQNGLIKNMLLGDRRHVLTLDTAGDVTMWDLIQCIPVRNFGKQHLDDVAAKFQTQHAVANWCAVNTSIGALTCTLEENHCFDAEMYADELAGIENTDFKQDQRVNLGKWVLRYLFSAFILEEISRDEEYRYQLSSERQRGVNKSSPNSQLHITLPPLDRSMWQQSMETSSQTTPRPFDIAGNNPATPGMSIAVATPLEDNPSGSGYSTKQDKDTTPTGEKSLPSLPRKSLEKPLDYFSVNSDPAPIQQLNDHQPKSPVLSGLSQEESASAGSPETDKVKDAKDGMPSFSKRLRSSFVSKKLSRAAMTEATKMTAPDEKSSDEADSKDSWTDDKAFEDKLFGVIQRMRAAYEDQNQHSEKSIRSLISPSLPTETPVLKLSPTISVLIQEDRPDAGGFADLFEGSVDCLGRSADAIEKVAPPWLGEVLLHNRIPHKDIIKIPFTLEPFDGLLPRITHEASEERLNANRMLRAKSIIAYVAERLQFDPSKEDLKPEDYLELHCQNQVR
ncbi:MAG: hypothetical protein M1828_004630 [Chrysothrix sp. TS-e1954]|nr:MAG: hypothetical protein M1828_004630 [Chrysothrix sp. TS-e1954]